MSGLSGQSQEEEEGEDVSISASRTKQKQQTTSRQRQRQWGKGKEKEVQQKKSSIANKPSRKMTKSNLRQTQRTGRGRSRASRHANASTDYGNDSSGDEGGIGNAPVDSHARSNLDVIASLRDDDNDSNDSFSLAHMQDMDMPSFSPRNSNDAFMNIDADPEVLALQKKLARLKRVKLAR